MPPEIFSHLPQQWVGLFAIVAFIIYAGAQIVEKFPAIAKHVPFGKWWHNRQRKKIGRRAWVAEDNEVITAMQEQISTVVKELAAVNERVQIFTAFSVYDARWHHRMDVAHAGNGDLPRHYNFFEFERLWRADPVAAACL